MINELVVVFGTEMGMGVGEGKEEEEWYGSQEAKG